VNSYFFVSDIIHSYLFYQQRTTFHLHPATAIPQNAPFPQWAQSSANGTNDPIQPAAVNRRIRIVFLQTLAVLYL
jgi:hypothetical protein